MNTIELRCPYCTVVHEVDAPKLRDGDRWKCPDCGYFSGVIAEECAPYLASFDDPEDASGAN